MRAVLLRSLAVIGVGGIVLAGVLYVATTFDARPPTVLEVRLTAPSADDERVALITTSLELTFSEPVATEGAEAAVRLEPGVAGAVTWSGSTMIFTPGDPLALETEYVLTVDEGISDLSGNPMTELPPPFEFVTAGRPTLAESEPADGAEDVPLDAPITLTFSTLMDIASVEDHLRLSPSFDHELRWSGELLEIVPSQPLDPGIDYAVEVEVAAADAAGVTLGEPIRIAFRTVTSDLTALTLVPTDGVDGVAPISPIAVVFNQPIDPETVAGEQLTISPEVAGTLEVVALPDDPSDDAGAGSLLRFTPSGPLPSNTTFEVELAAELTTTTGETMAEPLRWSFNTGAPTAALSNGITFVTDRAGIANVWVMNVDGTGQRQVSAELEPVLDYAIAPDGSSLVVSDGRRLVYQRADGSDRRVLTDEAHLEFDPTYSPDGQRVAFARADVETGSGLGLWEWEVGGGDTTLIVLPGVLDASPAPSAEPSDEGQAIRAPRYSPDGQALAFVDLAGSVGILELPTERLTLAPFDAGAAPIWMPDSSVALLTGIQGPGAEPDAPFDAPVAPLVGGTGDAVHRLARSGSTTTDLGLGAGAMVLGVGPDGSVAYAGPDGLLRIAESLSEISSAEVLTDEPVAAAAIAPGEPVAVVIFADTGDIGSVELVGLDDGGRTPLAPDGAGPRWLP
jgi:Bacterial Ig-like domain/WD40-like Beta Propeller Repeat